MVPYWMCLNTVLCEVGGEKNNQTLFQLHLLQPELQFPASTNLSSDLAEAMTALDGKKTYKKKHSENCIAQVLYWYSVWLVLLVLVAQRVERVSTL